MPKNELHARLNPLRGTVHATQILTKTQGSSTNLHELHKVHTRRNRVKCVNFVNFASFTAES